VTQQIRLEEQLDVRVQIQEAIEQRSSRTRKTNDEKLTLGRLIHKILAEEIEDHFQLKVNPAPAKRR